MFNAMHAGTVCGCVWHHHCLGRMGPPTVVPPKCPNHPNLRGWFPIKRYTMTECMLCETAVGVPAWLCALCHTSVADMTARTLRLVGSTSWKKLYRDTMVAALWPAFFRHVVDVDDVDHDGVPEDHIHPLVRVAWMCIVAIIRSRSTLAHVADDDTVWDLGAWIERSFLALPARNYKVEVIKTLPAFKELKGSEEDLIRAFRVYLTESKSSKIVEVRRGIIRKKTTLNIFSAKVYIAACPPARARAVVVQVGAGLTGVTLPLCLSNWPFVLVSPAVGLSAALPGSRTRALGGRIHRGAPRRRAPGMQARATVHH